MKRLLHSSLLFALLAGHPAAGEWQDKVDPRVLQSVDGSGDAQTEFLVFLQERADLSGADALRTKDEKGRFVYRALTQTAARTQPALRARLQTLGAIQQAFWIDNMLLVHGNASLVRELAERPDVRRLSANPWVDARLPRDRAAPRAPDAPAAAEWNISKINATGAWALGFTGQGVIVGGQDTGYDWDHAALKAQYRGWDGESADHNYNWHDAIHSGGGGCGPDSPVPCDDGTHGTHTMGTMVGDDGTNQVGVAPGARWIGCRNMNVGWGTPATYAECFQWFVAPTDLANGNPDPARAPDVINNSWGCPTAEGCTDPNVLSGVVAAARAAGIVVVVSAGNSGSSCGTVSDPPSFYEDSFTVGNTDSSDNINSGSSRGPATADGSGRMKPDISAPGTSVRSCVPGTGFGYKTGTSMAGPHVAGTVALVLSAHPGLRGQVDRIEKLLTRTALPRTTTQVCGGLSGTNVPNNTYGWGRVDAYRAVGLDDDDADGMPNWWEIVFDLNPTNAADAGFDPDGDGLLNGQEFSANTDPTNGASVLQLIEALPSESNAVAVAWQSGQEGFDSGRTYDLYRSTSMADGDGWTCVASNIPVAGALTGFTNVWDSGTVPQAYYRVAISGASNEVSSAPIGVVPRP
ncbi:MAG TPA: S8 family serine peptidase [Kiritimatiellia bacterium]|nr:S8 family serine peptidase [Kiritimatiellia bacterium]HRZ11065.1 S8 family serine peptidase [Kiritimatiellia bacterium]HSA18638.1 S8 family serine peptidase [Kiritimatiellia bacterium]